MTAEPESTCPSCGGRVHPLASRCKHCRASLGTPVPASDGSPESQSASALARAGAVAADPRRGRAWRRWWPVAAAIAAVFALGVSAGVMLERWLQARRERPVQSAPAVTGASPRPLADPMPAPLTPDLAP